MENGYFVKITENFLGVEFVELAGSRGSKTLCSINGNPRKMKKIHPYKTMKGAERYIESAIRFDEFTGWKNREFEVVKG